jgi:hypothetical protein
MDSCTDRCTGLIEQGLRRMRIRTRTTNKIDFKLERVCLCFLINLREAKSQRRKILRPAFRFSKDLSTLGLAHKFLSQNPSWNNFWKSHWLEYRLCFFRKRKSEKNPQPSKDLDFHEAELCEIHLMTEEKIRCW